VFKGKKKKKGGGGGGLLKVCNEKDAGENIWAKGEITTG